MWGADFWGSGSSVLPVLDTALGSRAACSGTPNPSIVRWGGPYHHLPCYRAALRLAAFGGAGRDRVPVRAETVVVVFHHQPLRATGHQSQQQQQHWTTRPPLLRGITLTHHGWGQDWPAAIQQFVLRDTLFSQAPTIWMGFDLEFLRSQQPGHSLK